MVKRQYESKMKAIEILLTPIVIEGYTQLIN